MVQRFSHALINQNQLRLKTIKRNEISASDKTDQPTLTSGLVLLYYSNCKNHKSLFHNFIILALLGLSSVAFFSSAKTPTTTSCNSPMKRTAILFLYLLSRFNTFTAWVMSVSTEDVVLSYKDLVNKLALNHLQEVGALRGADLSDRFVMM